MELIAYSFKSVEDDNGDSVPFETVSVHLSSSPVLDLMVSCPTVCPSRSYWFRRELSPSTTTESDAFRVQE